MDEMATQITREALETYKRMWQGWIYLSHTTPEERELARMKIQQIERAIGILENDE